MSIIGLLPLGIGNHVRYKDNLSTGVVNLLTGFGTRLTVSTAAAGDDIWPGTATTLPIPAVAGEQMTLVSDSANDTIAGTGAQKISIHYLDANGVSQIEEVSMNGATPVDTVATNIRFVQEIHVSQAGSGLLSAGLITIYKKGAAATIYNQIGASTNQSLNTARMVPAGKTLLIWSAGGSAGAGKAADLRLRVTSHEGVLLQGLFHFIDNAMLLDNTVEHNYRTPRVVPSLAIVKMTSYATLGGANVVGQWEGILIDNLV